MTDRLHCGIVCQNGAISCTNMKLSIPGQFSVLKKIEQVAHLKIARKRYFQHRQFGPSPL